MEGEIVNRVAKSRTKLLDLETFYPVHPRKSFDIAPLLFQGIVVKEKEFREQLDDYDFSSYKDCFVAVHCSTDAIVPTWAFMLVAARLENTAKLVSFGTPEDLEISIMEQVIGSLSLGEFENQRVIIKGCSKINIPTAAYLRLTHLLSKVAKAVFYGEPCSTVPVFKRTRD